MPIIPRRLLAVLPFVLAALTARAAEPGTDRYGDPLPQGAVARLGTARLRHQAAAIAFAPDSKTFATGGSSDAMIRLWNTADGREIRDFKGHTGAVAGLGFTADGKTLYSVGTDMTLREWDVASGKEVRSIKVQAGQRLIFNGLVVRPGEPVVLTTDALGVREWDMKQGNGMRSVNVPRLSLPALCPDGKHFAAFKDNAVVLRDLDDKEVQRFALGGVNRQLRRLAFSADGSTLAATCSDLAIVVWDVKTGHEIRTIPRAGSATSLALSANGRFVAAKPLANSVRVYGVASGQELRAFDVPNIYGEVLAFAPDNKHLACCQNNTVHVWNLETSRSILEVAGHDTMIESVRFTPDGKRLVSAARDGAVIWWDLATTKPAASRPGGTPSGVRLAADGRTFYYGLYGGVMRGELADGKVAEQQVVHDPNVYNTLAAVTADGKLLAARGRDQLIHFYSAADGKEVGKLPPEGSRSAFYLFSPDGKQLAEAFGNLIRVWEVPSGAAGQRLDHLANQLGLGGFATMQYAPDGRSLLVVLFQRVLLIETATGHERWHSPNGLTALSAGTLSPDGRLAAIGSTTGSVFVLDTATGAQLAELAGHRGIVRGLDFSPDGTRLASCGDDCTILLWDTSELSKKVRPEPVQLNETQLADLWRDLGNGDAAKAYKALRTLADSPPGVAHVQAHIKSGEKFDDALAKKLITQLDDDDFDVREKAEKDLSGMGGAVVPLLREALKNQPSVELKTRADRVLELFKEQQVSTVELRNRRAVEVLETSGGDAAIKALKALAGGDAKEPFTADAKAALERLGRRTARP